ncbi:hypothetical protein SDC9_106825 [bioreactor metagenome]|uniref:Uncharacterized protein n=1 Tax=bioreactor metagenome TaxID=1076179 RepID=A0A645B3I5_9ZZZZ
MGDVDAGDPQPLLELPDVDPHLLPELGVQVRQGFVKEEQGRFHHHRPCKGDPLLLSPRELAWLTCLHAAEPHQVHHLLRPLADFHARQLSEPQPEGDVVPHVQVGEDGVGLEDHGGVPPVGRDVVHPVIAEEDSSGGGILESSHHPEEGGLAAPRGSEEGDELSVVHLQGDGIHGAEEASRIVEAAEILDERVNAKFHGTIPPVSGLPPCPRSGRGRGAR